MIRVHFCFMWKKPPNNCATRDYNTMLEALLGAQEMLNEVGYQDDLINQIHMAVYDLEKQNETILFTEVSMN